MTEVQSPLVHEIAHELAIVLRKTKQLESGGSALQAQLEQVLGSFDDSEFLSDKLRQINFAYGPGIYDAIPSWLVRIKHQKAASPKGDLQILPALALLLINEVVYIAPANTSSLPKGYEDAVFLAVPCNDVFAWATSDSDIIGFEDVKNLFELWEKDPRDGPTIWSMVHRRQMPQGPVEKRIREAGHWNIDALKAKYNLLPNFYDGFNSVVAGLKYERYAEWCKAEGQEPLPFDMSWHEGWKLYIQAHPDWLSEEWKREEIRRIDAWKVDNGYTPKEENVDG